MDEKYKQKVIPKVSTKKVINSKDFIKEYYSKNIQGDYVINQHLKCKIYFTSAGKSELSSGRAVYKKKVAVLTAIKEIVKVAEYNNFGNRKIKDPKNVLGYLNFKAKVYIDDKLEHVRIAVLLKTDFKAYYNHEVNIIKKR